MKIKAARYWLVTLRKHRVNEYVDYDTLDSIVKSLDKYFFNIVDYCLESHGKYKQLHAHMIVKTATSFRYNVHVNDVKDYILHFKQIDNNLLNASRYIHKHCKNHSPVMLDQIKYTNYYKYHYSF